MMYRALKEHLRVQGRKWREVGEVFESNPNAERTKQLLQRGYIEEVRGGNAPLASKKTETVWDLKGGQKYYYIVLSDRGTVVKEAKWQAVPFDIGLRANGNCFLTKESAKRAIKHDRAKVLLTRDAGGFSPDWGNVSQRKYSVSYDHECEKLAIFRHITISGAEIIFASEEEAEYSINKHRKAWLDYFGVESQNGD